MNETQQHVGKWYAGQPTLDGPVLHWRHTVGKRIEPSVYRAHRWYSCIVVVSVKIIVTPCCLVERYQRFGSTFCLHWYQHNKLCSVTPRRRVMFGGHVVEERSCVVAVFVVFSVHGMSLGWRAERGKATGTCSMHGEEEELAPGFGRNVSSGE